MVLSKRLQTVADVIHKHSYVFDVGADHGLVEKYLLDNNLVIHVVAVENKIGPYKQLETNLKGYKNTTLLLSDGIKDLPSNVNVVVLAGLGGLKIVDILSKNKDKLQHIEQIVVDAHRDIPCVRKEIINLGYKIEKEKIVYENNIFYFVISFVKGRANYSDDEIEFGYKINKDPLFFSFKENYISENSEIVNKIKISKKNATKAKEIEDKIRRIKNL